MEKKIISSILLLLLTFCVFVNCTLPSYYSSKDLGHLTTVKDQQDTNICWAFASISSSESSILKSGIDSTITNLTLDLNPYSLAYRRHNRGTDPLNNVEGETTGQNWRTTSGDPLYSATILSQWTGPISSNLNPDAEPYENTLYRLENAIFFSEEGLSEEERIKQLKEAIYKYGAITFGYNNRYEKLYYNPIKLSGEVYGHACILYGWDDNVAASLFYPSASINGGWLVKNSYNSLPFFTLSYESTKSNNQAYAFQYASKNKYDYNYFYDDKLSDAPISNVKDGANVFLAKKGENGNEEYLKAVNIGVNGKNFHCIVKIYTNLKEENNPESGNYEGTWEKDFDYGVYRTIEIDKDIILDKGSYFSVIVEVSDTANLRVAVSASGGRSLRKGYYGWNGIGIVSYSLRIKAFTKLQDKISINRASEEQIENQIYTGDEIKPILKLTYNQKILELNKDYTVNYKNNRDAGTGSIVINGIGDYIGTKQVDFKIEEKDIRTCQILYETKEFIYNGNNQDMDVTIICDLNTLTKDKDFSVSYFDNVNASNHAKIKIEGINNYKGESENTYTINQKDTSNCDITMDNYEFIYDGREKRPNVYLICDGKTLSQNYDYNLDYSDNISVGTAAISITCINNYRGSSEISFTILKAYQPSVNNKHIKATKEAKTLSDIELPEGWEWENPETEYNKDVQEAYAIYKGNDKDCYKNTSMLFKISLNTETNDSEPSNKDNQDNQNKPNNLSNGSEYRKVCAIIAVMAIVALV